MQIATIEHHLIDKNIKILKRIRAGYVLRAGALYPNALKLWVEAMLRLNKRSPTSENETETENKMTENGHIHWGGFPGF